MAAVAACMVACGMAEDDTDERKRTDYLTFDDEAFTAYVLSQFDLNGDGRLSRYEAERVIEIDCSGLGIRTLGDIGAFRNLESLDCSDNALQRLDVERCRSLVELRASRNILTQLSIEGLRSLRLLACDENALTRLNLGTANNLQEADLRGNGFEVLDFATCLSSLRATVRSNPSLRTVYYRAGQQIDYESPTELIER